MTLAILVLNYNTKELLRNCLLSVFKDISDDTKVFVIDNDSKDGSVEMVKKDFPKAEIFENNENLGFSAGNNVGLREIKAKYYLLLNSDTEVLSNSLKKLLEFGEESDFGIVSCKLEYKTGKFQANAGDLPVGAALFNWLSGLDGLFEKIDIYMPSFHRNDLSFYALPRKVGWVSGTAMLINAQTIEKIGYLDEKIFMYGEDVEYCYRALKKGIYTGWTNQARIIHIQGGSSKDPAFRQWLGEFKGILYLYRKYFSLFSYLLVSSLTRFFILVRIIVFLLIGKLNISKTYAKIFINV